MSSEEQRLLYEATYHGNPKVRLAALERIVDVASIAQIAEESVGCNIRIRALERLPIHGFESLRLRIALKDTDPKVCLKAVEGISDANRLSSIAREAPHVLVRIVVAAKIADKDYLSCLSDEVIKQAISLVEDQSVLRFTYDSCSAAGVRAAVVERLEDQDMLRGIALNEPDLGLRELAARRLKNPEAVIAVFRTSKDASIRRSLAQANIIIQSFGSRCTVCAGKGRIVSHVPDRPAQFHATIHPRCPVCNGRGIVPPKV